MKHTHTPAPWKTGEASWNEDGEVRYTLHGNSQAKKADAQLIEAAPDLLATLKQAGDCFGQHNLLSTATDEERREALKRFFTWWNHAAISAITKAGGF